MCPDSRRCELDDPAGGSDAAAGKDDEVGARPDACAGGFSTDLVWVDAEAGAAALRLNANLDLGALVARSSSRVLLRDFKC